MICREIINPEFYSFSDVVQYRQQYLTPTERSSSEISVSFLPKSFNASVLMDYDSKDEDCIAAARTFVQNLESEHNLLCTLCVHYGPEGFIDWHTNANAHMHNAICTFSDDGLSFFEYKNEQGEIVRLQDPIGWSVKKFYWGHEDPIEHRAVSSNCRITITFSSKDEAIIDTFIKTITNKGDE